jgi:hypothetical protein
VGGLLILALVAVKLPLEHTEVAQHISLATYDGIQSMLRAQDCPIVVVDITALRSEPWANGRTLTDRKQLAELVSLLAQARPAAIGIDIDFSPNYDPLSPPGSPPVYHAPDSQDPDLFDLCLRLRQDGLPVALGVYRSSSAPRREMLVEPRYADLAADIRVDIADNRVVPAAFRWRRGESEVPTLSSALAGAYRQAQADPPSWLRWALHREVLAQAGREGQAREIFVDFSPIDSLVSQRVDFLDAAGNIDAQAFEAIRPRLAGKILLLGAADPQNPREGFSVAGRRAAYPGVYLHASAVYTQLRSPLLALTPAGRIALDVTLAAGVLAAIYLLRWRLAPRLARASAAWQQRLPLLITLAAMSVTFVAGVGFVNFTRIIWDDFILVFAGLCLHLPLERTVERWRHRRTLGHAAAAADASTRGER